MIDTHCHLTFSQLANHVADVIAAARHDGVDRMICVGTTCEDADKAFELTRQFDGIFATVGVHPHYADANDNLTVIRESVERLAAEDKVVALGEMGLDRHYDKPSIEKQKQVFAGQLEMAVDYDLPIIIHNREATDQTIELIRDSGLSPQRFVFHCFTGDRSELDAVLDLGAMVSFTGIVTFKNSRPLAEAATSVPLDRLMVETDSPYLTPVPHRKVRPNEPRYVKDVARFLASQRDMSPDDFIAKMDANAERFFRLPGKA